MRRVFTGLAFAAVCCLMPVWALAGDQETAQRVAGNLKSSGRLQAYAVDVKCANGIVTLHGRVTSDQQAQAAMEVAEQTPGVERVYSNLQVAQKQTQPARGRSQLQQPGAPQGSDDFDPVVAQSVVRSSANVPLNYQSAMPNAAPRQMGPPVGQPLGQPMNVGHHHHGGAPAYAEPAANCGPGGPGAGYGGPSPIAYDNPQMPGYAWPSYASYPNYAAVTYPKQYSPTAWPFIGPFYPYPQVPLGWRKVTMEWDDGWWFLDFDDRNTHNHHH